MRHINSDEIYNAVYNLFLESCVFPDEKLEEFLQNAKKAETTPHAVEIFSQLIENISIASEKNIPLCQDTGMAVVFVEIGQDVHIDGEYIEDSINKAVKDAYTDGKFRMSVLSAIHRKNTQNNTPAVIHTSIVKGDRIKISVAPKGFGSENMSKIKMLTPSNGLDGIKEFIIDTVKSAGGNPCPPISLGIGIGGTFELSALNAKKALLRPLGKFSDDKEIAELEKEMLDKINSLGIGPMGLGGNTTALAVNIIEHPTHLAGLPVAINIQCHCVRHKEAVI
ncbi:MAG: fumarate hydratase [Eubacteriales bacterium]